MTDSRASKRAETLSEVVSVRLSKDESDALRTLANGVPLSRFVRDLCLEALVSARKGPADWAPLTPTSYSTSQSPNPTTTLLQVPGYFGGSVAVSAGRS